MHLGVVFGEYAYEHYISEAKRFIDESDYESARDEYEKARKSAGWLTNTIIPYNYNPSIEPLDIAKICLSKAQYVLERGTRNSEIFLYIEQAKHNAQKCGEHGKSILLELDQIEASYNKYNIGNYSLRELNNLENAWRYVGRAISHYQQPKISLKSIFENLQEAERCARDAGVNGNAILEFVLKFQFFIMRFKDANKGFQRCVEQLAVDPLVLAQEHLDEAQALYKEKKLLYTVYLEIRKARSHAIRAKDRGETLLSQINFFEKQLLWISSWRECFIGYFNDGIEKLNRNPLLLQEIDDTKRKFLVCIAWYDFFSDCVGDDVEVNKIKDSIYNIIEGLDEEIHKHRLKSLETKVKHLIEELKAYVSLYDIFSVKLLLNQMLALMKDDVALFKCLKFDDNIDIGLLSLNQSIFALEKAQKEFASQKAIFKTQFVPLVVATVVKSRKIDNSSRDLVENVLIKIIDGFFSKLVNKNIDSLAGIIADAIIQHLIEKSRFGGIFNFSSRTYYVDEDATESAIMSRVKKLSVTPSGKILLPIFCTELKPLSSSSKVAEDHTDGHSDVGTESTAMITPESTSRLLGFTPSPSPSMLCRNV